MTIRRMIFRRPDGSTTAPAAATAPPPPTAPPGAAPPPHSDPRIPPNEIRGEYFERRLACVVDDAAVPGSIVWPQLAPPGPLWMSRVKRNTYDVERFNERILRFGAELHRGDVITRVILRSGGTVHDTRPGAGHPMRMAEIPWRPELPESWQFADAIPHREPSVSYSILLECDPPPPFGEHSVEMFKAGGTVTQKGTSYRIELPPPTSEPLRVLAVHAGGSFSDVYRNVVFEVTMGRDAPWFVRRVQFACIEGRVMHRPENEQYRPLAFAPLEPKDADILNRMQRGYVRFKLDPESGVFHEGSRFALRFQHHDGSFTTSTFRFAAGWNAYLSRMLHEHGDSVASQRDFERSHFGREHPYTK